MQASTFFSGYEKTKEQAQLLCLLRVVPKDSLKNPATNQKAKNFITSHLRAGTEGWVVFNKTCFYPEGGGPLGEKGSLKTLSLKPLPPLSEEGEQDFALVLDTQKRADLIFHRIKVLKGVFKEGVLCEMEVDKKTRQAVAGAHSATHLLHQALRQTLGSSVRQMGSLVRPCELRFDFSWQEGPLSSEKLKTLLACVTKLITQKHSVEVRLSSKEQALKQGALCMAGENYPQNVRTIRMGKSFEFCGGIHVKNTAEIKGFKIISETGVRSGVRRITAYTGDLLKAYQHLLVQQINHLTRHLKTHSPFLLPQKNNVFISWLQAAQDLKNQYENHLKNLKPLPPTKKTPTPEKQTSLSDSQKAHGNEELRAYLKQPLLRVQMEEKNLQDPACFEGLTSQLMGKKNPKSGGFSFEESADFFIPLFEKKIKELQNLHHQVSRLKEASCFKELLKNTKTISLQGKTLKILTVSVPIQDRKILAEVADRFKNQIPGDAVLIILRGDSSDREESYPLIVSLKDSSEHFHAHRIFQQIARELKGRGGGKKHFAQGSIKTKEKFLSIASFLNQAS